MTLQTGLYAQGRGGRGGGGGAQPQNAKAAAVFDPTGYWVSIVTEDWRYRMVTPSPGDYQGVPMTPEARKVANAWDPAKEEASGDVCKSYGAPALLRVPGRLHITWQDDQTLKMDSRRRQADSHFSFRRLEACSRGSAHAAGRFDGRVGTRRRTRGDGWIAESHHIQPQGWVSAQERCSVQREDQSHGVLRFDQRAQRGSVDGGHHRHHRPHVSDASLL